MFTLFISTYSSLITIGLFKNGKVLEEKIKESERSHSIYLLPMIDEILKSNNLLPNDLNDILVVNGPGSFTGIRLGVTVAKTLAYTLNINIKTISSIEAIGVSIKDENKIITISDNKGKYIGVFENNKLVQDLLYLSSDESISFLSKFNYKEYNDSKLNLEAIYNYSLNLKETSAHAVNPIYIKGIEALNGR